MIPAEAVEPYAPFDAHAYQLSNGILTFRDSTGEEIGTMTMAEFAQWREDARREWQKVIPAQAVEGEGLEYFDRALDLTSGLDGAEFIYGFLDGIKDELRDE